VNGFLRFFGLLNAAVWVGGAISFTLAFGPAFFSNEMKAILPPPYNGAAAQIVLHRYFILMSCCGALALIHFFLENLYLGKTMERFVFTILLIVIGFGLIGGFWLQPKLKKLHLQKYSTKVSTETRTAAEHSFKLWHGVSQSMNLIVIGGLLVYFWRVSSSGNSSRFVNTQKFRG